jgi:hypothetical protein
MTRYIPAFSWPKNIEAFIREVVTEAPVLNVCSGHSTFGDVHMDKYEPADVQGDWTELPFEDNSFGAVFSDPPWDATMKKSCADFCKEAMRVAPVLYLMTPWIWGTSKANLSKCWVRQQPGINNAIVLSRYERVVP